MGEEASSEKLIFQGHLAYTWERQDSNLGFWVSMHTPTHKSIKHKNEKQYSHITKGFVQDSLLPPFRSTSLCAKYWQWKDMTKAYWVLNQRPGFLSTEFETHISSSQEPYKVATNIISHFTDEKTKLHRG